MITATMAMVGMEATVAMAMTTMAMGAAMEDMVSVRTVVVVMGGVATVTSNTHVCVV